MKKLLNNLKKGIIKKLQKMAEANKRNFGNNRLDCCSLDKENKKNYKEAIYENK